jgi:hypothetical protein
MANNSERVEAATREVAALMEIAKKAAERAEAAAEKAAGQSEAVAEDVGAKVTFYLAVYACMNEADKAADEAEASATKSRIIVQKLTDTARVDEQGGAVVREFDYMLKAIDKAVNEAKAAVEKAVVLSEAARKEAHAAIATETFLLVEDFFEKHKESIYERLEECDDIAKKAVAKDDMMFIAESLPIINGLIHVGSKRKDLNKAIDWVRKEWGGEADPIIVLSALVFIYIADQGVKEFRNSEDQEERMIWTRIEKRVQKLL